MKNLFRHESYLLKSSSIFWILFCCVFLATIYSLDNGRRYYDKQLATIAELKLKNQQALKTAIDSYGADTTTAEGQKSYYAAAEASHAVFNSRLNVFWEPSALSVLSIGNRDLYPYYQEILPISLYMRLFKNEISNPVTLLSGNVDFSYIIIFLIPLFLIALTFNLVAFDNETGVAPLIRMDASNLYVHYGWRFGFYMLIAALLLAVLFVSAVLFLPKGFSADKLILLYLVSLLYLGFWLVLSYLVNMAGWSAVKNISLLLSFWLFFTVLLPSIANQYTIYKYPVETGKLTQNIRRVQLTGGEPLMKQILARFYKYYPEYKQLSDPDDIMFTRAYLAQGEFNDLHGDSLFNNLASRMQQKSNLLSTVASLDPAMFMQQLFCRQASTDLPNYLTYLNYVRRYNNQVKRFYFKHIFGNNRILREEYQKSYPQFPK